MKIYALLDRRNDSVDTICISENIKRIRRSLLEDFKTPERGVMYYAVGKPDLEIWLDGEFYEMVTGKENILKKLEYDEKEENRNK